MKTKNLILTALNFALFSALGITEGGIISGGGGGEQLNDYRLKLLPQGPGSYNPFTPQKKPSTGYFAEITPQNCSSFQGWAKIGVEFLLRVETDPKVAAKLKIATKVVEEICADPKNFSSITEENLFNSLGERVWALNGIDPESSRWKITTDAEFWPDNNQSIVAACGKDVENLIYAEAFYNGYARSCHTLKRIAIATHEVLSHPLVNLESDGLYPKTVIFLELFFENWDLNNASPRVAHFIELVKNDLASVEAKLEERPVSVTFPSLLTKYERNVKVGEYRLYLRELDALISKIKTHLIFISEISGVKTYGRFKSDYRGFPESMRNPIIDQKRSDVLKKLDTMKSEREEVYQEMLIIWNYQTDHEKRKSLKVKRWHPKKYRSNIR